MTEWTADQYKDYMNKFTKNKYGAKKCDCLHGHTHASKGESRCCNLLISAFPDSDIANQKRYTLKVNGIKISVHIPDFTITHKNGLIEIYEFKGMATEVWKLKYKIFRAIYPDIPYYIITKDDLNIPVEFWRER